MKKQVKEYKEALASYSKDDEIQKLQKEIQWTREHSIQMLSDVEMRKLRQFRCEHSHCNQFCYLIGYNGIENSVQVSCKKCRTHLDLSDQ